MIRKIGNSLRYRWRRMRAARQPVILMYHRVATLRADPWNLAVSPEHFRAQIEHLKRVRRVVPLEAVLDAPADGPPLAAVTFDDGYADVHANAWPILQELNCPATVFLTTGAIGAERAFWWDDLARIVLEPEALPAEAPSWTAVQAAPAARRAFHDELWARLRPMDEAARRQALADLADWAGVALASSSEDLAMTETQVRDLRGSPLRIGAHSVSHPRLPDLTDAELDAEVAGSRSRCEALADGPVTAFAYPFGDHDDRAVEAARRAGFTYACTVEPGGVRPGQDALRLPRFAVTDMDANAFARWLP